MKLEYFSMVDRIIDMNISAGRIVCQSDVPLESSVFKGHFPGFPVLPGVLQTEIMAQVSGHLCMRKFEFGRMAILASVRSSKYRGFVLPGDMLVATSELAHFGSDYAICQANLKKDDAKVASSEIRLKLIPFPNDTVKEQVINMAIALNETLEPA